MDLGLRAWDVVRLVVLVLLEALFDALDWLVNLANIAGRGTSELSEMINQRLKVVIKIIGVLDHSIKLLDLVIELLLGQIFLLLLLLDLSQLIFFPILQILNLLSNLLSLLVLFLDLGLHQQPLGEVVDWVGWLFFVNGGETLRDHVTDVVLHDVLGVRVEFF